MSLSNCHAIYLSVLMKFYSYWCHQKSSGRVNSKFFEQGMNNLSLEDKGDGKEPKICIKPPPPPLSPASVQRSPSNLPPNLSLEGASKDDSPGLTKEDSEKQHSSENQSTQDIADDDFGDFQAAG